MKKETSNAVQMWTLFDVRLNFLTKLCGSTPGNPALIETWTNVRASKRKSIPPDAKSIPEIQEEVLASLAQEAESEEEPPAINVFQRWTPELAILFPHLVLPTGTLLLRAATFRAHIKDCSRVLSTNYIGRAEGEKSFSSRVMNCVYEDPKMYWVPILRPSGEFVTEPDGAETKPIHARGPRGLPVDALKTFEWIQPASVVFHLQVLGNTIKKEDLETVLMYGGTHGYGGERSAGEGKYTFSVWQCQEGSCHVAESRRAELVA